MHDKIYYICKSICFFYCQQKLISSVLNSHCVVNISTIYYLLFTIYYLLATILSHYLLYIPAINYASYIWHLYFKPSTSHIVMHHCTSCRLRKCNNSVPYPSIHVSYRGSSSPVKTDRWRYPSTSHLSEALRNPQTIKNYSTNYLSVPAFKGEIFQGR